MKKTLNILMTATCLLLLSASNSWAEQKSMPMHTTASNPCSMTHGNPCNPCAKKQGNPCNPCNPCAKKQGNPCNPCNPCATKQSNPCNPCNPCAKQQGNPCNPCNPCAKKQGNPCNPCNPCAKRTSSGSGVDPKLITRPAGTNLYAAAPRSTLVNEGKQIFSDPSLGTNGLTCATCHTGNAGFQASFAEPYPHRVAMAKDRAGLKTIDADEFVQFCIVVPLKGTPLAWEGKKLAALTAYVVDVKQRAFQASQSGNPCNPCSMKHGNPCNPCAGGY
ncbi:c-type cytochrome [Pseudomonadota bacterium]